MGYEHTIIAKMKNNEELRKGFTLKFKKAISETLVAFPIKKIQVITENCNRVQSIQQDYFRKFYILRDFTTPDGDYENEDTTATFVMCPTGTSPTFSDTNVCKVVKNKDKSYGCTLMVQPNIEMPLNEVFTFNEEDDYTIIIEEEYVYRRGVLHYISYTVLKEQYDYETTLAITNVYVAK